MVLELVQPEVAARITRSLSIPAIGIGSGPDCDGQVLVTHDLIGLFPWFRPRFAKPEADVAKEIRGAIGAYRERTARAGSIGPA
jgi:3-methyl-2-oxobutanoate hydroxymethyltransferase